MTSVLRPGDSPRIGTLPGIMDVPAAGPGKLRRIVTRAVLAGIVVVLIACVVILALTGKPVIAAVPAAAAFVAYLFWTQPLRRSLMLVIFAQCLFFEPCAGDNGPLASGPLWTIMKPGNDYMNVFLNQVTGIGFLSLTGQELLFFMLFGLLMVRELRGQRIDSIGRNPGSNVLFAFIGLEVLTLLALEVWGAATGGNMRSSLFQFRMFLWLPLETLVISLAMRDLRDFRSLAITITVAALLKVAAGLYFIVHDAWSQGLEPPYMTGHQDSVMYVIVIFLWIAAWAHKPSWQRFFVAMIVFAWIIAGVYVNNRRIAYVSLVASLFVFYTILGGQLRRRVNLGLLCAAPFVAVYLLLARTHSTGIFAPGAQLIGIAQVKDGSSQWRILEMQNLIFTLMQQRVLGSGFGHEWIEIIKLPDISVAFPQYRLIAHNSIMWILGISGIVGFSFLWMPIVVGIFLAARSYRFARTPIEQTAAATIIITAVCYVNQCWGDIGIGAPLNTLMMASGLAMAGKLARETGAWSPSSRVVKA
jgi:hypothetical protein